VRPFGVTANEKWIDVDLSSQTLNAYEGNNLVYTTLISSGMTEFPTVTGMFRIWLRFEKQTMDGARLGYDYYLENVPYVMYFYEDYALHGAYWHNNFGVPMSHGCVNIAPTDAGWLYAWSDYGTVVNVHQ
jgi:lipoprotein-anchoring transpeptidase ErfK/SrfK